MLTHSSSSSRNGRHYDEDLIITERDGRDRDSGARRRRAPVEEDHTPRRRRSPSLHDTRSRAPAYSTRDELDIAEEADYYNSRAAERSYLGEGYHGANKDWAIVDVPPGTKRVEMEGIGGAKAEITWQRYNGVRRSKFMAEDDAVEYRGGGELMAPREREEMHQGRRFVSEKDPKEKMWTEITKDLVTEEAIKSLGYDFEETEFFYYVMSYLRYVSLSDFSLPPPSFFLPSFPPPLFLSSSLKKSTTCPPLQKLQTNAPNINIKLISQKKIAGGRPPPRRSLRGHQARAPRTYPRDRI